MSSAPTPGSRCRALTTGSVEAGLQAREPAERPEARLSWREKVSTLVAKRAEGQPSVPETVLEPDVVDLIAKIERLVVEVAPPDSKRRLHPTVSATRKLMRRCARDEWPSRFNRIRRREPLPEPAFIAEVGTGSIDRATQLLQAFVDAVLGLGGSLVTDRGDVVGVVLLGEPHGLRLRERLERHREAGRTGSAVTELWRPTGVLELHLEEWLGGELLAKWADDSNVRLEERLCEVLESIAKLAQATRMRNNAVRRAAEQKQREREERERVARKAERARHRAAVLQEFAERHDAYVKVRRMLAECEHDGSSSEGAQEWFRAALAAAEAMNVMSGGAEALRDRVEKRIDERMGGWHFYEWGR